jgi:hypothetical protein
LNWFRPDSRLGPGAISPGKHQNMKSNVVRLVRDDEVEEQQVGDVVFDDGDGGDDDGDDGGGGWEIARRIKYVDETILIGVLGAAFNADDEDMQILYVLDEPAFWRRVAELAAQRA